MLNYKHLHYFHIVAKAGGITQASEQLHITPQTISGQLTTLEHQLGSRLFEREGRKLVLTGVGKVVQQYTNEIFSLGGELEETVRNFPQALRRTVTIGVSDVVPKSIAHRLIAPIMEMDEPTRIICREGPLEILLAELAIHKIDLVIADCPIPSNVNIQGYNHFLGDSGITFLTTRKRARIYRERFPQSLDGAPFLMPRETAGIRGQLAKWIERQAVIPRIVGEFDDSALLKAFGRAGAGIFFAPTSIVDDVKAQYGVEIIGSTEEVREQFYAITVERRITHPAVVEITQKARDWLKQA